jgi:thiol-disulfide isomerase/thioredoxin
METKEKKPKRVWKKVSNYLFIGLMLFVVFNTNAKSWVLKQLVSVGLFQAEIKKESTADKRPSQTPSFYFTGADGKTVSTADLKGKVVFINFWATWCPPCRAEMPTLDALYRKLKDDNRFVFLFMNEDNNPQKANDYLQSNGYAFPLVVPAGTIPGELYSGTLPTTLVLDKEGKVVLKHEGLANYNTDKFLEQLKGLL